MFVYDEKKGNLLKWLYDFPTGRKVGQVMRQIKTNLPCARKECGDLLEMGFLEKDGDLYRLPRNEHNQFVFNYFITLVFQNVRNNSAGICLRDCAMASHLSEAETHAILSYLVDVYLLDFKTVRRGFEKKRVYFYCYDY